MTDLAGRVALVTGAGRRVGRAIAVALGAQGMRVAVHYNESVEGARDTASMIEDGGGSAALVRADLSQVTACEQLIDALVLEHGELHTLVNSAAIMQRTPIGSVTEKQWDAMFALNVKTTWNIYRASVPAIRLAGGGALVGIGSAAGLRGDRKSVV